MTPKHVIHLLSGGLDSTVLLYDLIGQGYNIHCLLFDYGQHHAQELQFAKLHCHRLNVMWTTINLPRLQGSALTDGTGSMVVPFRNPIMLAVAVNFAISASADSITIGCNADDRDAFPDCRWATLDALNHVIKLSGYSIEICAPYINEHKWWIARKGSDMGVKLFETWSCYEGGAAPCGQCDACKKREEALRDDHA